MRLALVALAAVVSSCALAHERGVDAAVDAAPVDASATMPAHVLWVLVHPSSAPLGPGLFQIDEPTQQIVSRLPLPDGVASPHALAWDGSSLWLGDLEGAAEGHVYQLDPTTGAVLSRLPIATEGLVVDASSIWYASSYPGAGMQWLVHVTRGGDMIASIPVAGLVLQDLAVANGSFYYLINDDLDRIVRVDPASGAEAELTRGVDIAPYALGFDGVSLAVAVDGRIRRFDPSTGAPVSDTPLAVPGWITAIAFVR
jgi:hypothetical protein